MSESWTEVRLGDLIALQRGHDLPARLRVPGPFPVVGSGGPSGWHNEAKAQGPGVVIGRATNLGRPFWVEGPFWPLNTGLYVKDFRGNDPRFVFHLFESLDLSGFDSGSVQPMLNRNYIAGVKLRVPPLDEQRRIAGVLGALDDLIETNQRLIANLVRQADAIALQHRLQAAGELRTFGAVAKVSGGGTPSTKSPEFWGGSICWATPTDMTALPSPYLFGTSRTITQAGLDACSSELFPEGSILMTSRATIGPSAVTQVPTAVNQGFIVVEPLLDIDRWFLFHEMRRRVPEFIARANGSTFLEISRGVFKSLEVEWPDTEARSRLHRWLEPLHAAAAALQREVADLSRTRDELLPLLLSGRVSVREVAA